MINEQSIIYLLDRAELCEERLQYKIARRTLQEAFDRMEEIEVLDSTFDRAVALDEKLTAVEDEKPKPQSDEVKCGACNGTGKYRRTGLPCYRCIGKGVQDAEDRTRNANYDAFAKDRRERQKAAYAANPLF